MQIWDADPQSPSFGEALVTLDHGYMVANAVWGKDELHVLSWSDDGYIWVWDVDPASPTFGEPLATLRHDLVMKAVWSRNKTRVLSYAWDDMVHLWDIDPDSPTFGAKLISLPKPQDALDVYWSPDERYVLACEANSLRLWQIGDRNSVQELSLVQSGSPYCSSPGWNSDGTRLLMSPAFSDKLYIWDSEPSSPTFGQILTTLTHEYPISTATLSKDKAHVLVVSNDSISCRENCRFGVHIWDIDPPPAEHDTSLTTLYHAPDETEATQTGAMWSRDETRLLSWSSDGTVRMWNIDERSADFGKPLLVLRPDNPDPSLGDITMGVTWNEDETRILTWHEGNTAWLWDADEESPTFGALLLALRHGGSMTRRVIAGWNRDETRILTWSDDRTARLWDADEHSPTFGQVLVTLTHEGSVSSAQWNQDETRILTWSAEDKTIRLWDADEDSATFGQALVVMSHGHKSLDGVTDLHGAAWNRDETRILSWGGDDPVRVWDADEQSPTFGEALLAMEHGEWVEGAAWNADETRVISWSRPGRDIKLWDTDELSPGYGTALTTMRHMGDVQQVLWNKLGTRLLASAWHDEAKVWDVDDSSPTFGTPLTTLHYPNGDHELGTAIWNKDDTRILTWGMSIVRVWDADENSPTFGKPLIALNHDHVWAAAWSEDERHVLSWSMDGAIKEWLVDVDALIQIGQSRIVRPFSNQERERFFLPPLQPTTAPVE